MTHVDDCRECELLRKEASPGVRRYTRTSARALYTRAADRNVAYEREIIKKKKKPAKAADDDELSNFVEFSYKRFRYVMNGWKMYVGRRLAGEPELF